VVNGADHGSGDSARHSLECVRLAYERTLMAWLRTALSLIAIGFTIYKLFSYNAALQAGELGPREFGMLMIGGGLATLVLGLLDQRRNLRRLRLQYGPLPYSSAGITAGLIGLLGVVGLLAVVLRQ
jgi:putative membrane protein